MEINMEISMDDEYPRTEPYLALSLDARPKYFPVLEKNIYIM